MDPLSEILSLMRPGIYGFRGLDAGGDWAIAYGVADGVKCFAITSGDCWLVLDDVAAPVRLTAGDVVLLPTCSAFRLCSAPGVPAIDAFAFFPGFPAGESATLNGGGDCAGVGGYFGFSGVQAERLLGILPPIVHISGDADKAALRESIARLMRELRVPQPGSALIAEHLAQALLIEALRLHLADHSLARKGWLFALADGQMRSAIAAMHADPARTWTLDALARIAGMSRSSFALRFKETVGESAMAYLTRWRMTVAADRLASARLPLAEVAASVGYASESAFGATFKRVIGESPRRFASGSARSPGA